MAMDRTKMKVMTTMMTMMMTMMQKPNSQKANARDGGFSVVVVPDPETPSEFALELRATEDPDGEWKRLRGHPSSTAYVDWIGTLQALERSARRRFAPSHFAPGGIWLALMRAVSARPVVATADGAPL
eukprot:4842564-Pyramimonas_sp.AAC.1